MRVLARHEPTHLRDRLRLVRLAAELLHTRGAGVDVVDVEVDAHPPLAGLHVRDSSTGLLAGPRHVVLGGTGVRLELPSEKGAPELATLRGVVGWDLEVHDLAGHLSPLVMRCPAMPFRRRSFK